MDVFIILIIFNTLSFIYYEFFIFSFGSNHLNYFVHKYYYILEWLLMEINSILMIIRYNIRFSIFLQLIWFCCFGNILYIRSQFYIYDNKKSYGTKFLFFLDLLAISNFIIRFISLFLINKLRELKIFKIFELFEIFFLTFCLFYFFNKTKITSISQFIKTLDKQNSLCYLQIKQYFSVINQFFFEQPINMKITEKAKENLLKDYEYEIKNYFCINEEDYNIICEGNEALKNALNFKINSKKKEVLPFLLILLQMILMILLIFLVFYIIF